MKIKQLFSNPNVHKWIFYASLIVFAGVCFYVVCPKWEYIFIPDNSIEKTNRMISVGDYRKTTFQYNFFRHNRITNNLHRYNLMAHKWEKPNYFQTANNDYYEALVQIEEGKRLPKK